ncbi:MAG: T9SS type A sorting domain-containing protein [Flavobacteriales bacterium]
MQHKHQLYFALSVVFALFTFNLKAEDTIKVKTHDRVHWPWYGSYARVGQFPESGQYRKILMHYTLGCPATGCSQWDYTTMIRALVKPNENDSFFVELGRIITPYAGTFANMWRNTWTFDVTDYAPILKGDVKIDAFYAGWQDGFTITLDFDFIEGVPPRDSKRIQSIYHSGAGGFEYGIASNPIENHLVPVNIGYQSGETHSAFFFTPTGHSFGGNENCAEFCPKNYYLKINGQQRFSNLMWRDECGMNPIFPQGGTWLFDRSNWCPGDRANTFRHELTPFFSSGNSNVDLDFDPYTYNGGAGFNPNYIVDAHVIYYGAYNFNHDVALESIIRPNRESTWRRFNPMCMNPMVRIKNEGRENLTSCLIRYGIINGPQAEFQWTGNLAYGETADVQLGDIDWTAIAEGGRNFICTVSLPNGQNDEQAANNTRTSTFNNSPLQQNTLEFRLRTNNRGFETAYTLSDREGNVLYSRSNLDNNTLYRDTFQLADGCYALRITDSGKNGLSFFANNDGSGSASLHRITGTTVFSFATDFGTEITYEFMAGLGLSTEDLPVKPSLRLFPNPTAENLQIELPQNIKGQLSIDIFDLSGKRVISKSLNNFHDSVLQMKTHSLQPGIYIVNLMSDAFSATARFAKVTR